MTDNIIPEYIDVSWKQILPELLSPLKPFLQNLEDFYPNSKDIFNVFRMPLKEIKVVILGQDPYPNGQAIGYAFAVAQNTPKPASLRNIEKEVGHPLDKELISWRNQGVFLLNTALTVQKHIAGSHVAVWTPFTQKLIEYISSNHKCIWLLWGNYAKSYSKHINTDNGNQVLMAAHPAAESYRKNAGFYGCNHFKKASFLLNNTLNF